MVTTLSRAVSCDWTAVEDLINQESVGHPDLIKKVSGGGSDILR